MSVTHERSQSWYTELGGLISAAPDLVQSPASDQTLRWLGRVSAIMREMGLIVEDGELKDGFKYRAGSTLSSPAEKQEQLRGAIFKALGVAERKAPTAARGSYIAIAASHDALVSIAAAFGEAKKDLFIVDPYLDQIIINRYAPSAPEGVQMRLLTGQKNHRGNLKPAVDAWREQYQKDRPVEVKLAKDLLLHDRLIIADGTPWWLSQSFNHLAERSPATLQPFAEEIGRPKVAFYEDVWQTASAMHPMK